MFRRQENQLELFELSSQPAAPPTREPAGRLVFHLRHDQIVLTGMAGLIGLTVIFACGVERGKQLVRSERGLLARQQPERSTAPAVEPTASVGKPKTEPVVQSAKSVAAGAKTASETKKPNTAPSRLPADSPARAIKTGKSRYAIQVVTYSRPQLAKQEMDRLRARGEPAFLIIREGRVAVYVGPFPSKDHASEKLAGLKNRDQDCFLKTL